MSPADLSPTIVAFLLVSDGVIAVYAAIYFGLNLWMLGFAFRRVRDHLQRRGNEPNPSVPRFSPLFSLLVPAYNEEVTVVESLRSLLRLDYPAFELIVVNDGSRDRTVQVLLEAFDFHPVTRETVDQLPTATVRCEYSALPPEWSHVRRILLIDKENGGKADALNAALNAARGAYVCSMDADSLLVPDALNHVVQPILDEPNELVALGVQIAVSNGSEVSGGQIVQVRLPDSVIARIQVVEYMRSFTQNRTALGQLNLLLILSGAFAVFQRDLLLVVGGFLTPHLQTRVGVEYAGRGAHTVSEDMEVVVRIHRYLRDHGRLGKIRLLPEPLAWTEVPENMGDLGRQRARWQRGLLECLWLHRKMIFRRKFGAVGRVALPYQLFFEALTPIIEAYGVLVLPISAFLGILAWRHFFALTALAFMLNVLISVGSIAAATWSERSRLAASPSARLFAYDSPGDLARLTLASLSENLIYRQILLWWRLRGTWDFLRSKRGWDKFKRKGFVT